MWELDCEESWAPKNWCFWTVVLEKILEIPLDCKYIQPTHIKEISPEYLLFIPIPKKGYLLFCLGLKLNIQKTKIMASSPITSWQIDGETMGTMRDFIFLGFKITADCDCSHEIKRHLLLGRKVMTNLDSILKSRDLTLPTKVHLVKAMVVMYGCESWTVKKAEHRRIDAFELWCWRRLLRVPWTARRDPTSPFWRRSALGFLWKEWC